MTRRLFVEPQPGEPRLGSTARRQVARPRHRKWREDGDARHEPRPSIGPRPGHKAPTESHGARVAPAMQAPAACARRIAAQASEPRRTDGSRSVPPGRWTRWAVLEPGDVGGSAALTASTTRPPRRPPPLRPAPPRRETPAHRGRTAASGRWRAAAVARGRCADAETAAASDRRGNQRVHGPLIAGRPVTAAAVERDEPVQSRSSTGGLRRPRRAGDDPCAGEATSGPGNPGEGFGVTSMTTRGASAAPRGACQRGQAPRPRDVWAPRTQSPSPAARNRARPANAFPREQAPPRTEPRRETASSPTSRPRGGAARGSSPPGRSAAGAGQRGGTSSPIIGPRPGVPRREPFRPVGAPARPAARTARLPRRARSATMAVPRHRKPS